MSVFYVNPVQEINKTYNDLFKDLNSIRETDLYIQEVNTYTFFVQFIKKIISNKDCYILDSDFSKYEMQQIEFEDQVDEIKQINVLFEFKDFDELLYKIKSSTSEISIFTSGTTGKPKRIVHSIDNLIRTVKKNDTLQNCVWAFAYNPTHIAGIQVFFQALFNKNTLIDVFKQSRDTVYAALEKYNVTHISATPTFYRLLLPFDREFVNVKRITFGGEKSDFNLYEKLKELFPNSKITNIYASTELGTLLHANGELFTIPEVLKNDVLIKDNELFVRATLLGKSIDLVIEDGMYRTGDVVEIISINPVTFKFITRISDYVNVGGYKVNVQEVEEVLSSIDGVLMSSVTVKPSSVLGNMLIANVVSDFTNSELSEKNIKTILKDKLQEFKIPRIIKIVKELEFTRTGKISKK